MLNRLNRIHALMAEDETVDLATAHARDRAIGRNLSHLARTPGRQILAWAAARGVDDAGSNRAERRVAVVLIIIGTVLGMLSAAGALYFDGGQRVNVLALLALLVGIQLITLAMTGCAMVPAPWRRKVPGLDSLTDALSVLSPARAGVAMLLRIAPTLSSVLDMFVASARRQRRVLARARRWTLWCWSQEFAVAFNLGVLLVFVALVVFTDLAFGWSTTLDLSPSTVKRLTDGLSTPWRSLIPDAVPSLALIEASRFFRAGAVASAEPEVLGQWWRFVLVSLLLYGLAPRLALLGFAKWRRVRAIRFTVEHLPGAPELLYRLNNEWVASAAPSDEAPSEAGHIAGPRLSVAPTSGSCTVVLWGLNDLDPDTVAKVVHAATGLDPIESHHAGGASSVEHDQSVVGHLAGSGTPLVLLVKSWEPPLAELTDFLSDIRNVSQEARSLIVVPISQSSNIAPVAEDVAIWRDRLWRLADPWLSVRTVSEGWIGD